MLALNLPISSTATSAKNTIAQIPLEDENSVDSSKPKDNAVADSNISASADSTSDCSSYIDIEQILDQLKESCSNSPFLAILADETTDKATQTQLSVCVRFTESIDNEVIVRELFLGFLHAKATTEEAIVNLLLEFMNKKAIDECRVVISKLERMRQDDTIWESLFEEAKNISGEHDIEPSCSRRVGRQQNRANVPADSASDYWRRVLYYVFLDHLINELQQRLIVTKPRFQDNCLLPSQATKNQITDAKVDELFTAYRTDIPADLDFFKTEVDRWIIRLGLASQKPSSLCETLNITRITLYPCIWNILTVLITMHVATATAERSFSVLRRVKTYLRTTMHQERLSALGLMHIHREIQINVEGVIETFASRKNRKMSFLDTVSQLMEIIEPDGVKCRLSRKLRRRQYASPGSNFVWHIDSYDKLKPYGIAINGCIDGFSRRCIDGFSRYMVWLEAVTTNNDPKVISNYFIKAVKEKAGCPQRVRSDFGTENVYVANMQKFLRRNHNDEFAGDKSYLSGKSTHNQRIEWFWGILRKQMSDLDDLRCTWNTHTMKKKTGNGSGKRPILLYSIPHIYNAEGRLYSTDEMEVLVCEGETTPKKMCDETVFELCTGLMTENNLMKPSNANECKKLDVTLRQILKHELADL
ncbi:unnamed protein product [Mytilus coruscus]|uniref:Uncharacterized protein n=1 Tax=Mytilus coruscus TaxID=42192 RepID=A0A6J8CFX7_MYTCO|nr:unnamed protein product [Mytilus coruscus]